MEKKEAAKTAKTLSAAQFLERLTAMRSAPGIDNGRYFSGNDPSNRILNVRMNSIFILAKEFMIMPMKEIELLLDSTYYEARMGAVSIMDFQARDKKSSAALKRELYELYLRRHDRINNWDLVDRSAPYVVGCYLSDKPRTPLNKLARSKDAMERRTAIVSTYYFIRQNETADTFRIAELLVNDPNELVNKAVGSWVREAGKRDHPALLQFNFLHRHAATMPRITLRYAIEKLSPAIRTKYLEASR